MSDEIVPLDQPSPADPPTPVPDAPTAPAPAPAVDEPVAMVLAPPGYRVSYARRLYSMRDEPGELCGAQVIEVPSGSMVGRGTMELDRGGKTYVTSIYNGTPGWSPADYLREG